MVEMINMLSIILFGMMVVNMWNLTKMQNMMLEIKRQREEDDF